MTSNVEDTGQYVLLGPPGKRYMAVRGVGENKWRVNLVTPYDYMNLTLTYQQTFDYLYQVYEYVERETRD